MRKTALVPFLLLSLALVSLSLDPGLARPRKKARTKTPDTYVCAYVWPSCHDDSLAHRWLWEEGIGEWEVIQKGDPRFPGHYQPRQPLWGYEMDDDPAVVERWIRTALKFGINTFIYDWYWYSTEDGYSGPYLESALDEGFLQAPSHEKMNFYIMWANHDVKYNYWNYHKWGDREDRLFNPDVDWDQFKQVVERIISRYFSQPGYVKIDGCPVLGVFSIGNFVRGFGSEEEAAKAMDYFREEVVKAGFPGLHLQEIHGGGFHLDAGLAAFLKNRIARLGINSVALYNMGGFNPDYLLHGRDAIAIRQEWDEAFDVPVFPCVSVGWDDTPRFPAKGADRVSHFHNTPQAFGAFLATARQYVEDHPDQPRFLMINAWNEWVEGSYLLPDMLNGYGYLQAVRDVLDGKYDKTAVLQ